MTGPITKVDAPAKLIRPLGDDSVTSTVTLSSSDRDSDIISANCTVTRLVEQKLNTLWLACVAS